MRNYTGDEGRSFEFVDDAIEDGVGNSWIADDLVPALDRQLAGDEDRMGIVAILDDLKQVAALFGVELVWSQPSRTRRLATALVGEVVLQQHETIVAPEQGFGLGFAVRFAPRHNPYPAPSRNPIGSGQPGRPFG